MAEKIETKLCSNCNRQINVSNFIMHETFCLKNVRPCDICKMPVDQKLKNEHFEEYHAKEKCECGTEIEKIKMENHKINECLKRKLNCKYCDIPLYFDKLEEHVNTCGTRTELCNKCNCYVQLKDQELHFINNCKYPIPIVNEKPKINRSEINIEEFNPYRMKIDSDKFYRNNKINNQNEKKIYDPTKDNKKYNLNHDNEMLPCEFCDEAYPIDSIIFHQAHCQNNPDKDVPSASTNILDPFENLNFRDNNDNHDIPVKFLNSHLIDFNNLNRNNIMDANYEDYDKDEQNVPSGVLRDNPENFYRNSIPCEFCGELFDLDFITNHQENCENSLNTLDGLNNLTAIKNFGGINVLNELDRLKKTSDPFSNVTIPKTNIKKSPTPERIFDLRRKHSTGTNSNTTTTTTTTTTVSRQEIREPLIPANIYNRTKISTTKLTTPGATAISPKSPEKKSPDNVIRKPSSTRPTPNILPSSSSNTRQNDSRKPSIHKRTPSQNNRK